MTEKPSVLAPYEGLDIPPPELRDPVRFAEAERTANEIMRRIEAEVKRTGIVRAKFDKERVGKVIDAFRWHLPAKVLAMLKLDEKIKTCEAIEKALKRGVDYTRRDGTLTRNRHERMEVLKDVQFDLEFLTIQRTYLMGAFSFGIRGWEMGQRDQRMLDAGVTTALVLAALFGEACAAFRLKVYHVEKDEITGEEREVEIVGHPLLSKA